MRQVPAYRPPWRGAVPYEQWFDDAACLGMPTKLFELKDLPSKLSGEEEEEQHSNIAKGLAICTACPVRQACKANAIKEDRYWTTRGGQPPEGLFRADYSRSKSLKPPKPRGKACRKGHDLWVVDSRGRYVCAPCRKARSAKDYKVRAGKG